MLINFVDSYLATKSNLLAMGRGWIIIKYCIYANSMQTKSIISFLTLRGWAREEQVRLVCLNKVQAVL